MGSRVRVPPRSPRNLIFFNNLTERPLTDVFKFHLIGCQTRPPRNVFEADHIEVPMNWLTASVATAIAVFLLRELFEVIRRRTATGRQIEAYKIVLKRECE